MTTALYLESVNTPAVHSVRPLFSGIANWPDLQSQMVSEGLRVIADHGFREFLRRGGSYEHDQGFRFEPCGAIAEIVMTRLEQAPGFRWCDKGGATWVLAIANSSRRRRVCSAFGVSWRGLVRPLDPIQRRTAIRMKRRDGDIEFAENMTGPYVHLRRLLRCAQAIEFGLSCLPAIVAAASRTLNGSELDLTDDTLQNVHSMLGTATRSEVDVALRALKDLTLMQLTWEQPIWRPRIVTVEPAVRTYSRIENGWRIQIASLLPSVLKVFSHAPDHEEDE